MSQAPESDSPEPIDSPEPVDGPVPDIEDSRLFIGLMSGTSIDAIDCALVKHDRAGVELLHTHSEALPGTIQDRIGAISHSGPNEIENLGTLDREIGELFAAGSLHLLQSANVSPEAVAAIGSHGQTIRHRPPSDSSRTGQAFTLQIGDPNTIAERTGITTVADFRRRDIAAGGEGAPLAPAFHRAAFSKAGTNRAVVNIGGIANVSLLEGDALIEGFDSGPGNTLLDLWIREHRNQPFDRDGAWGNQGEVAQALLQQLLEHPYFEKSGPRSTGKESFNRRWLEQQLIHQSNVSPVDVQATLTEFTATSIARAIAGSNLAVNEVYVCGGGAHNGGLLQKLSANLAHCTVASTTELGISPDWVEAVTFAWLAQRTLDNLAGNEPRVTGARGERVLGAIFPA